MSVLAWIFAASIAGGALSVLTAAAFALTARSAWITHLISYAIGALLTGLIVLAFEVLKPFIVPVIWAVILAHVTWPFYRRALRAIVNRVAGWLSGSTHRPTP